MEILKRSANILVIDDEENVRNSCLQMLQLPNVTVYTARDVREAMDYISRINFALIIADSKLPGMSSDALPMAIKSVSPATDLIMAIECSLQIDALASMKHSANGYLIKPFEPEILKTTIYKYLLRREKSEGVAWDKLVVSNIRKEVKNILGDHKSLDDAALDTVLRLTTAAEYHDKSLGQHLRRIVEYSTILAEKMDFPEDKVKIIGIGSMMHDIGKVGISDAILLKPAKLTKEEFEEVKKHSSIGAYLLQGSRHELLRTASVIALTHHEKFDGTGYPQGLLSDAIPLPGRIVAIADVFDALVSKRVYKPAYSIDEAVSIMKEGSKKHFDPVLLRHFLNSMDRIKTIINEFPQEKAS